MFQSLIGILMNCNLPLDAYTGFAQFQSLIGILMNCNKFNQSFLDWHTVSIPNRDFDELQSQSLPLSESA